MQKMIPHIEPKITSAIREKFFPEGVACGELIRRQILKVSFVWD
jgi:hypothetical protein